MKRKNYWLLFAVLLLSLSSLSPGIDFSKKNNYEETNGPNPPVSPRPYVSDQEDVTISVAVQMDEEEWVQLQKMNAEFVSKTGIEVQLTNYTNTGPEQFIDMLKIGEGPDVMLSRAEWIISFASDGYLLPVESYQSASPGNELLYSLMTLMEWNGYQWATPFDMNPYLLVWQNVQMKELGVSQIPSSLSEWEVVLSKLEEQDMNKPHIALDTGNYYGLATLMGGAGESLLSFSEKDSAWLKKMQPYITTDDTTSAIWKKLNENQLLMGALPASVASKLGTSGVQVQLPKLLYTQTPAFLKSRAFAVSASTNHAKEAAEWISFMTSEEKQEDWLLTTHRLPARRFIYESSTLSLLYVPFEVTDLLESTTEDMPDRVLTAEQWNTLSQITNDIVQGKIASESVSRVLEEGHESTQ